jgi:His/Glu/Gln/Arg/opine family amino acid ABC transporter permease subunit
MVQMYVTRKDQTIPFLSLLVTGMVAISVIISIVELPFPDGPFTESTAPIATTTIYPWVTLFIVSIAAYWIGIALKTAVGKNRLKRVLTILWVASYPVIIMVIQRKPILHWSDIFGFGDIPFLESDLGALIIFTVVGGAILWWLGLPTNRNSGQIYSAVISVVLAVGIWIVPEVPGWVAVITTIMALGLGGLSVFGVQDPGEQARLAASEMVVLAILVWFVPMSFLYRTLIIIFSLVALAAPSFGGTAAGRTRIVRAWAIVVLLAVITFRLGIADTALEFQSTSFMGGFNMTILLAITGVVLSFPLGAVLALARTSTMPIFRLLATGYIELIRSVPLITWLFFGSVMLALFLPQGVEFDEVVRIVAAVSIFSAAYVAENQRTFAAGCSRSARVSTRLHVPWVCQRFSRRHSSSCRRPFGRSSRLWSAR